MDKEESSRARRGHVIAVSLHIFCLYGAFLIKTVWDDLEQNLLHFTTFMRIANICQGYFCQFIDHN